MTTEHSLAVQDKKELQSRDEQTIPGRFYVPSTDIFENDNELVVVMEVPGVEKKDIDIRVENQQLSLEARLETEKYTGYAPVYTEYNVGHYSRSFRLSSKIDSAKIDAKVRDGVLTLRLPKVAEAKPRKIKIGQG